MSPATKTKKVPAKKRTTAKRPAPKRPVAAAPKARSEQVQELATRSVTVPIGAALTAYDRALSTVSELVVDPPSREDLSKRLQTGQKRIETRIKRFERRGTTARKQAERRVKRTRRNVERELRRSRTTVKRAVRQNRTRLGREIDAVIGQRSNGNGGGTVTNIAEAFSNRFENAVGTGVIVGQKIVTTAQERVARVA